MRASSISAFIFTALVLVLVVVGGALLAFSLEQRRTQSTQSAQAYPIDGFVRLSFKTKGADSVQVLILGNHRVTVVNDTLRLETEVR